MKRALAVLSATLLVGAMSLPAWAYGPAGSDPAIVLAQEGSSEAPAAEQQEEQAQPEAAQPSEQQAEPSAESSAQPEQGTSEE